MFTPLFSALCLLLYSLETIQGGKMLINSLKRSVLAILAVASVSNADQFNIVPGDGFGEDQHAICDNPYDSDCDVHQPGSGYGQSEVKSVYIGRSVRNEVLHLRKLSGIGAEYRGWEVVSVRARTRPDSPYQTTVQLVADGYVVDTQVNPGHRINLQPNHRVVIGSNTSSLHMRVSGSTIIEEIAIELRRVGNGVPNHPQPPQYPGNPGHQERVDLWIGRTVYGNDRIDLLAYVDMYRYRGRRIEQVIVQASPQHNVALAELLVNGFSAGTLQFESYGSSESLQLHNRPDIGGAASSLMLYTRGNMTVERVTLILR